jgi:hypothetical protein
MLMGLFISSQAFATKEKYLHDFVKKYNYDRAAYCTGTVEITFHSGWDPLLKYRKDILVTRRFDIKLLREYIFKKQDHDKNQYQDIGPYFDIKTVNLEQIYYGNGPATGQQYFRLSPNGEVDVYFQAKNNKSHGDLEEQILDGRAKIMDIKDLKHGPKWKWLQINGDVERHYNSDFGNSNSSNVDVPSLDRDFCKICYDKTWDSLLIPCMHVGLCQECAAWQKKCPFCRHTIDKCQRVYQP